MGEAWGLEGLPASLFAGVLQVRHCTLKNGLLTMSFSSTLQILKVNAMESGVAKATGKPWDRQTAECMLLADDGTIECVGRLVLPTALRESAAVGIFRAVFALVVPTFGDQKGDVTARLSSLIPVPVPLGKTAPVAPRAAVPA